MMAFKVPWNRDTRLGLFGSYYDLRKELMEEYNTAERSPSSS